jgi:hypothetical protein
MSTVYIDAGHGVKWQPAPDITPAMRRPRRPRLAGHAHVEDWVGESRAIRTLFRVVHPRCPSHPPKGGSEKVALEIIENIHLLDNQALNLLRFGFAVLVKLSPRR